MVQVEWTIPARDQLKGIHDHLAGDSPQAAERLVRKIVYTTARLTLFPRAGEVIPDFSDCEVRQILCRPYRILYRHLGEVCWIVAVIHASRDLQSAIDPKDLDLS